MNSLSSTHVHDVFCFDSCQQWCRFVKKNGIKKQQQNHQLSMFPYSSDKCGCIFLLVNQPLKIRTSMIVYTIQCPISVTIVVYIICMWFCLSIYVKYTRMSMMYELVWNNMTCVIGIHKYYMLLYDIRDSKTMATSCHLWRQLVISSRHCGLLQIAQDTHGVPDATRFVTTLGGLHH